MSYDGSEVEVKSEKVSVVEREARVVRARVDGPLSDLALERTAQQVQRLPHRLLQNTFTLFVDNLCVVYTIYIKYIRGISFIDNSCTVSHIFIFIGQFYNFEGYIILRDMDFRLIDDLDFASMF